MSSQTVTISFNAEVRLEQREGYWAAFIEPLAMTVYGKTREAAERRAEEGLDFFVRNSPDLRKYLDAHNIPHYATENTPVRRTLPVQARVKSPVYA